MNLKGKLQALLCNPEGKVVIEGSEEDKKLLEQAIESVESLEKRYQELYLESLNKNHKIQAMTKKIEEIKKVISQGEA